MPTNQQLGIYVHGAVVTQSPVHGGLIPTHGGKSPVHGSPNAFNPADLFVGGFAGMWFDPSNMSTLFQDTAGTVPVTADGQSVARINDLSGNGNHLIQATAAARPLFKTSGGLNWLLFDGVDDAMQVSAPALFNDMTILGAVRITSGLEFFGCSTGTANASGYRYFNQTLEAACGNGITDSYNAGAPALGTDMVIGGTADSAGTAFTFHTQGADEAAVFAGGLNLSAFKVLTLGANANLAGNFGAGRFYGGIFIGKQLAAADRNSMESYLAGKSGAVIS